MPLSRKILAIITFFMHVAKKKKINKTDTDSNKSGYMAKNTDDCLNISQS